MAVGCLLAAVAGAGLPAAGADGIAGRIGRMRRLDSVLPAPLRIVRSSAERRATGIHQVKRLEVVGLAEEVPDLATAESVIAMPTTVSLVVGTEAVRMATVKMETGVTGVS